MSEELKLVYDPAKIKIVPIQQIQPNAWNPKKKDTPELEKIKKSIKTNGLRDAILVRELAKDSYEIIDGEQRFTAAWDLGYQEVNIYNEGTIPDKLAKELTIWYQQQVPFDKVEEAYLVHSLLEEYKDTALLPYTDEEIVELEAIAAFDFDAYNDKGDGPDDGMVSISFRFTKDQADTILKELNAIDENKEIALLSLVKGV